MVRKSVQQRRCAGVPHVNIDRTVSRNKRGGAHIARHAHHAAIITGPDVGRGGLLVLWRALRVMEGFWYGYMSEVLKLKI